MDATFDEVSDALQNLPEQDPRLDAIALEMQSLSAIYPGVCGIDPHHAREIIAGPSSIGRLRYQLCLSVYEEDDVAVAAVSLDQEEMDGRPTMKILVSLGTGYPDDSAPQLQLLGRYIGKFPIGADIFGQVTRTYISQSGITHTPGQVSVFEGIDHVRGLVRAWYDARVVEEAELDMAREGPIQASNQGARKESLTSDVHTAIIDNISRGPPLELPTIHTSESITVSKSVFLGHAIHVNDVALVPHIINHLLQDKRIARATHPAIYAYRISKPDGHDEALMADNDDDGESAAGGRLAHLLQILELKDVLVIVTRWYGGVLLGPERFKLINQAARDALQLAGFLSTGVSSKGKKRGK